MFKPMTILKNRMITFSILLFSLTFPMVSAYAEDKAIIVFDASGSMWGQLEGKTKIAIAKDTLSDVVTNWDDSKHLGLLAYGHRRKGDCSDIETLIPVGKINKTGMISQVSKINPKGKTPISASIRMAAEELKFTEDEATVILISDGKESCNADPCATAAELEKLGVNFTAHVVGFGVDKKTSKQLKCIADNTGGKYFNADNAKELNDALQQAVVEKPKQITLKAINADTGKPFKQVIEWNIINQDTEEVIKLSRIAVGGKITISFEDEEKDANKNIEQAITNGNWLFSGSTGHYSGEQLAEITLDEDQTVVVEMKKQLPKVTLIVADEAIVGTALDITWEAEKALDGKINLQLAGSKHNQYTNPGVYIKDKSEIEMRLPSKPGDYVLRFFETVDRNTVIAERPITLKPAEIKITAPDEAGTGTEIDLSWQAPKTSQAVINLQHTDDKPNYNSRPYFYVQNQKDSQASMRMPSKAGDYILRYYNQSDQSLMVERPIKLVAETITISAPDEAGTGTEIDLSWKAPKSAQAVINLQSADDKPNYNSRPYFYVQNQKDSQASMRMPSTAGDYVLRYYNQSDQSLIAERPIKLIAEVISINAPDEVSAGTEIDISWDAPKSAQAVINLQLADEKPNYNSRPYFYVQNNKEGKASMRMPSVEGDYVLRYYNQSDQKVVAERPIKITAVAISINAPDEATAGTEIDLTWEAPKGLDSFINIHPVDEKPNYNAKPYVYTKQKASAVLRMPSVAGDYILRWYNRNDRKIMHERPIKVVEVEISITAPDEATAGTEIDLSWNAPKGLDSFINLHPADEKPNYNAKPYIYTKKQVSGVLRMPSVAGDYILRWYNRNDRKMMHERPIRIVQAEININVPDEIKTESEIEISWDAPKGLNSFINIQKAGEKPNYNAKPYIYTIKKTAEYMKMPEETGEYVLRWYSRDDRKIMSEKKITIISE